MDEGPVPALRFETSRLMNEFCHVSVLYSDHLPAELSMGMLGNKQYQNDHANLRYEIDQFFQKAGQVSARSWYSLARVLMRARSLSDVLPYSEDPSGVFLKILGEARTDYDEIWEARKTGLDVYRKKFLALWIPIGDRVLRNISSLTKNQWPMEDIRVHFVHCLFGGFAWIDCIGFAAFPDFEVQKKFLAHELSELMTPSSLLDGKLVRAGLNPKIAHTVVDMIAYFSVKDFINTPEKKGIRPNPNHYAAVEELYPFFDHYAQNPSSYNSFETHVQDMIQRLTKPAVKTDLTPITPQV